VNTKEVRFLYDYTEWANNLVLDAAATLSEEELLRNVGISHRSIQGTLVHMMGAEWIWLERWKGTSPKIFWTEADFPSLAAIRERWNEVNADRKDFLAGLSDFSLVRELKYVNTRGEELAYPLIRLLQHVVNHATLHRGQVVGLIREFGHVPPATDMLFYLPNAK
jgi:uncharacterized damage-inducible protein DinB